VIWVVDVIACGSARNTALMRRLPHSPSLELTLSVRQIGRQIILFEHVVVPPVCFKSFSERP
jgi:hypothetical protein